MCSEPDAPVIDLATLDPDQLALYGIEV